MSDDLRGDTIEFDDAVALALASVATSHAAPRPEVKQQLLARLAGGFVFRSASAPDWLPYPVPGIRMKVLALNREVGYATLLLDIAPGTRVPSHHHSGAEECYVLSGSLSTVDRRMTAGDFLHADPHTDHAELWTEEGCRVLLVVPPEDYLPEPAR
jgi:anti-sigma factor ChrR (cupin superfamily)